MTPDQAEAAVNRLAASFRARMSKGVRQTWADALTDLDHTAVTDAIDHLTRTEVKLPSIAAVHQAATNTGTQPKAAGPRATWQVLLTWTDPDDGLAYAEPSRWHTSEPDAIADYETASQWATTRDNAAVELIRYVEGRPPQTIERTT